MKADILKRGQLSRFILWLTWLTVFANLWIYSQIGEIELPTVTVLPLIIASVDAINAGISVALFSGNGVLKFACRAHAVALFGLLLSCVIGFDRMTVALEGVLSLHLIYVFWGSADEFQNELERSGISEDELVNKILGSEEETSE